MTRLHSRATAFGLLMFAATATWACSVRQPGPTDEQLFGDAKEVFIARVTSATVARFSRSECQDAEECEHVKASYELVEPLKGKPRGRGKVVDVVLGLGNCSLGVLPGWYYVFYVNDDSRSVLHPGGSFAVGPVLEPQRLAELRAIREPPHSRPRDGG